MGIVLKENSNWTKVLWMIIASYWIRENELGVICH